ncbi:MAG: GGDEF domain-containing protein [Actinomycetota bacterium]|nr:GGDEF domain-containing protein [Actinomycetota bacterium]
MVVIKITAEGVLGAERLGWWRGYTRGMESTSRIPDQIRRDLPNIVASWREARRGDAEDGAYSRLTANMEQLVSVFIDFLNSPDSVETFTRGGAIRGLVGEMAENQHELGREAVGVIEDFAALRRCIWRTVEKGVDLPALGGGEVSAFFLKLMQASDWVTEAGLEAFDAIVRREMEQALGRAAATDLVTGLPNRDQFNRLLLPQAIASHERLSVAIFDVAHFTETVAAGKVRRARQVLRRLADTVRESVPEDAVCARFGDDEISAILPAMGGEAAYRVAEAVLERLAGGDDGFEVDVGLAEFPEHGADPGELVGEALKALKMAKRVGGSGIVVAR